MRLRIVRRHLAQVFVIVAAVFSVAGFVVVRNGQQTLESVLVTCSRALIVMGERLSVGSVVSLMLLGIFAVGIALALVLGIADYFRIRSLERRAKRTAVRTTASGVEFFLTTGLAHQAWTSGIFRPRIYVSMETYGKLSEKERVALLAHECAHVRHHDVLKRLLADIVKRAFWFVPTVREAAGIMRLGQEVRADRAALSIAGRRALCNLYLVSSGSRGPALSAHFAFITPRLAEVLEGKAGVAEFSARNLLLSFVVAGAIISGGWFGRAGEAHAETAATCAIIETAVSQTLTPLMGPIELYTPVPLNACSAGRSC